MAAVIIQSNNQLLNNYITQMSKVLSSPPDEEQIVRAALTLGEIGVFADLSGMQGIIATISNLFEHPDD